MHADKDSEIGAISAIGPFAAPPPTKYERLLARARTAALPAGLAVMEQDAGDHPGAGRPLGDTADHMGTGHAERRRGLAQLLRHQGHVLPQCAPSWPAPSHLRGRCPALPLQTSFPRVFAIGDVRAGSTKRVAFAAETKSCSGRNGPENSPRLRAVWT